ncbi:hypothetical protein SNOG_05080 [Parastagonospora nodorum SN15]|uniref:Uncharacterized protein n=1 Tax=Phaeosphaeria nodorum (strain SN15 / ATCC MYA-4574 / FGSC 10173) TaxID=321614 RepID=Q0UT34_PHANO|nr:hypothetical protein SNOG_05080 [Parastagonospora nodorum SN15]EAT87471.1 hypothetical protein SNOG_05080 [Parastagonospora nodorum SN15]
MFGVGRRWSGTPISELKPLWYHPSSELVLHDYHLVLFVDERCVKEDSMSLEVISLEPLAELRAKYLSMNQYLQIRYAKAIPETLNERRRLNQVG